MKNVLLIGDSIRMGYDKSVRKTLEGVANVYFPDDNCRFASYVLRYIHEYKFLCKTGEIDLIHWNAGLWDCVHICGEEPHTPIEIYKYYIDRICKRIQKVYPNAKVIFATSTAVQSEKMSEDFKRYNQDIEEFNAAAVGVVKKYGFEVNDLYALSVKLPPEAHSDAVHYYTGIGTQTFTDAVINCITKTLDITDDMQYSEDLYTDKPIGF